MLLKVSRQHVRKMVRAGPLPAVKIGREWRIEKDYLKTFWKRTWYEKAGSRSTPGACLRQKDDIFCQKSRNL